MRNPVGRPSIVASSVSEYCVFAMQTGVLPRPIDSRYVDRAIRLRRVVDAVAAVHLPHDRVDLLA